MKTATLTSIQAEKATSLLSYYKKENASEITAQTRKLSDFYNKQTTKYASCLNDSPFIIKTDTESVVKAGYSKLCKAVITVDETHPGIIELKEILAAKNIEKRLQEIANEKFRVKSEATKKAIETPELKEKLLAYCESHGIKKISHKEANQLAWKKQPWIEGGNADIVVFRAWIKHVINGK